MKDYRISMHRGWYYIYQLTAEGTWHRIDSTASRSYQEAKTKSQSL